ncbi:MAG: NAD(P)/FAD-dependent oxidoreductase [Proteobacteria bacterium]|nr:NAD(P)/FAD-dependent oxidoreductase [Desulfobulbaceae bacterium]MBU4152166.1 NAD(P)/FAD-dependent oxidoreductase [Pseudomonadota bacterium]
MSNDTTDINKTFNIVPGPKMGMVTPEFLAHIAEVAQKHNIPMLKLTEAQRLAFIGQAPEAVEEIWQDLGHSAGPRKPVGIHYIKACPGKTWCKYGVQDSLTLGATIEKELLDFPLPAKTKVGVSGCSMNCCEGFVRDIGVFGRKSGWTLVFGGNGAGRPRFGDIIGESLTDEQLLTLLKKVLIYYRDNARPKERTARFMDRTSVADLHNAIALL